MLKESFFKGNTNQTNLQTVIYKKDISAQAIKSTKQWYYTKCDFQRCATKGNLESSSEREKVEGICSESLAKLNIKR